ncbi:nucleic acid/nucleotide deaminase domain-containing protein [Kitasatospora sp. NPDC002227]|uniref:nucleic acid/nucleotide deaminase domain-containing protein n=1 Tax=Kitasatospora sp. NPDC002227 TaxID=3154773 RepID=UPI0033309C38
MTNQITKALDHGLEKMGKEIGEKVGTTVQEFYRSAGTRLKRVASTTRETDLEHAAKLRRIGGGEKEPHAPRPRGGEEPPKHPRDTARRNLGPTPVYRVRDDGKVEKLTPHGPRELDAADRKRLAPLKLNSNDEVMKAKPGAHNLPKVKKGATRPTTDSTKVPLGGDELSRATQLARHEDKSYGNYAKRKGTGEDGKPAEYDFTSNNYAAARHGEAGDKDGFILVGRSRNPNPHSERVLGIPLLESGSKGGLTELYTEREPCTSAPNCSAWMAHHFPSSVRVTHSVEYGNTPESRAAGNRTMEHYLNGLRPKPHSQYRP